MCILATMNRATAFLIVGLTEGSSPAHITARIKELQFKLHPDKNDATYTALFQNLMQAKCILLPNGVVTLPRPKPPPPPRPSTPPPTYQHPYADTFRNFCLQPCLYVACTRRTHLMFTDYCEVHANEPHTDPTLQCEHMIHQEKRCSHACLVGRALCRTHLKSAVDRRVPPPPARKGTDSCAAVLVASGKQCSHFTVAGNLYCSRHRFYKPAQE